MVLFLIPWGGTKITHFLDDQTKILKQIKKAREFVIKQRKNAGKIIKREKERGKYEKRRKER